MPSAFAAPALAGQSMSQLFRQSRIAGSNVVNDSLASRRTRGVQNGRQPCRQFSAMHGSFELLSQPRLEVLANIRQVETRCGLQLDKSF